MENPMKIKKKNVISVQDWDKLVQDTYGRPYKLQQQDGCRDRGTLDLILPIPEMFAFENDTVAEEVNGPEMGVSFKAWLARDPKAPLKDEKDERDRSEQWAIDMWWNRNFYPTIESVADDLYKKGLIEAGEYLIDIDW